MNKKRKIAKGMALIVMAMMGASVMANTHHSEESAYPEAVQDSTSDKSAAKPWKCTLKCEEEKTQMVIDLYEETVDVPGMDMFGPMNGYLGGNIYGVWSITSCSITDERHAKLRLSNDLGSETQECILSIEDDGTYRLSLKGSTVVKRVEKKKLVKVSSTMVFNRTK